ncbi:MAG: YbbR-like domain-containing protein [Armatimonadota bacterium]
MTGRSIRNWLRDTFVENWPVKLLALVVASVLWLHVLGTEDPQSTQAITVPVVPVNEPEGLETVSIMPETVELRLRGRESALAQAQTGRIRMQANLRGATAGENEVPLRIAGVPYTLGVRQGYPTTARVELDKIIERSRPVDDIVRGEPARGFVIEQVTVDPEEVTVRGATSVVREVARAVVVVDVSGINQSAPFEVEVEARDNRNVAVTGVQFDPPTATVNVNVRELNVKYVPVRPVLGDPPAGYRVADVQADPEIVTITSEDDLSDARTVPTLAVDISGLRGTKQYSVSLNVPPDVRVEGPASVQVTVTTQRIGGESAEPPSPSPDRDRGQAPDGGGGEQNGEDNGVSAENQVPEVDDGDAGDDGETEPDGEEPEQDQPADEQDDNATTPGPENGNGT